MPLSLTDDQSWLAGLPIGGRIFLEGPAGSGKTTAGVARLAALLDSGVAGDSILVLTPQRALAAPYEALLRSPDALPGGRVAVWTPGALALRMVELFWPLVSQTAGFARPDDLPVFLNLETAQYYMARLVAPLIEEGRLFDSVAIDRNRLYSQVLDNLNKAALVGFSAAQIGERLKAAWVGEPGQLRVYDDVQTCATLFRQFCLTNNLLDFSLQVEVFCSHLWPQELPRQYLLRTYRHLIADNIEEDSPFSHDILRQWLPELESALLIYDTQAGYRRFLGADPYTAYALLELCDMQVKFPVSLVVEPEIESLAESLDMALHGRTPRLDDDDAGIAGPAAADAPDLALPAEWAQRPQQVAEPAPDWPDEANVDDVDQSDLDPAEWDETDAPAAPELPEGTGSAIPPEGYFEDRVPGLRFAYHRFYPQMMDWVVDQVAWLVHEQGLPPGEIVILAPILSDALRYSLMDRLAARNVPFRSHRPSRSLREEPPTVCLLTLAALAHPQWGVQPGKFDVAYALVQAIDGLDLVRGQLLAEIVYRPRPQGEWLGSFDNIRPDVQERITYRLGERYEQLRLWLLAAQGQEEPLDHFLSRLFGELLSQPGFGFHTSFDAGRVTANLIDSVRNFRWVVGPELEQQGLALGSEYLRMVRAGVIAAQYPSDWRAQAADAVLLAPAYTFLLSNRPVTAQFWLDAGSRAWAERLNQPLTHPYVLSREWPEGKLWNDSDEIAAGRETMVRVVLGLLRRCRGRLFLGLSELGEQGFEQRGPLLMAFQRILRALPDAAPADDDAEVLP